MSLIGLFMSPLAIRTCHRLLPLGLVTALAICATAAVDRWLLVPAKERLAQAKQQYDAARQAHTRQQAAKQVQEELALVWQTLPARRDFATLAAGISELARADVIVIPGMNYALQKVEDGLPLKASLTFRPVGEYAALRRFLHRLETTDPYLFIESLDASRAAGFSRTPMAGRTLAAHPGRTGASTPLVVFNIRLVTFLRPDPPSARGENHDRSP